MLVRLHDGQAIPKVIDFGVAKAIEQRLTERTIFTQYGQIIGTFEYMSPEQAEMSQLGVDTRSDIYSLGAMLYELLTGSTPLDKERLRSAGLTDRLRMIKEEEPAKPSARLSELGKPLGRTVLGQRSSLCQRVNSPCAVELVGIIANLDFVTVMYGIPRPQLFLRRFLEFL